MKKVNVGLIGFGTVGTGVVKTLIEKRLFLASKIGTQITIKQICDKDTSSPRAVKVEKKFLTTDPNKILRDPDIQIVVELIGGIHPAKEYIIKALCAGKDVVTANKALLAQEGEEIFKVARENSRTVYFEASVGGGIPIIKSLREGLISNQIDSLFGIINGTSNFILSEMTHNDCDFNVALKTATSKGYAELNPSLDIEGTDSAHKLAILVLLAFGKIVRPKDIFTEGISSISLNDIRYAEELGYTIKLLAIAKRVDDELDVRVHPTLLPKEHLLSSVNGIFNAIYVRGDMVGEVLFYGQGAGQLPAASAVTSDIVDAVRGIESRDKSVMSNLVFPSRIKRLRKIDGIKSRYYIRFMAIDRPGVLAKISGILGTYHISIASVTQKEEVRARVVPIVMMTHEATEQNLRLAIEAIDTLAVVKGKTVAIRMEAG